MLMAMTLDACLRFVSNESDDYLSKLLTVNFTFLNTNL